MNKPISDYIYSNTRDSVRIVVFKGIERNSRNHVFNYLWTDMAEGPTRIIVYTEINQVMDDE